jgi:hypothetical protein
LEEVSKKMEKRYSPQTEAFYRKLILPEEEKAEPTPPRAGFRWFRATNIVCFEHYRRPELLPQRKVS